MYLVAVIDWHSRYVLSWQLSNTLDTGFCLDALEQALAHGQPDIFNTDQGCQFTSLAFTGRLEQAGIRISMDGPGIGQHLRRATVAQCQIRVPLPERLRFGCPTTPGTGRLLPFLQPSALTPSTGLPNPSYGAYGVMRFIQPRSALTYFSRKVVLTLGSTRYRVRNCPEYNEALVQRGSLTHWIEDCSNGMSMKRKGKRGALPSSDWLIQMHWCSV